VVAGTAPVLAIILGPLKLCLPQVQAVDESIKEPNRIVRPDIILNAFGQKLPLLSILPTDKVHSLKMDAPGAGSFIFITGISNYFSHALFSLSLTSNTVWQAKA
jgi:hypothetical protein